MEKQNNCYISQINSEFLLFNPYSFATCIIPNSNNYEEKEILKTLTKAQIQELYDNDIFFEGSILENITLFAEKIDQESRTKMIRLCETVNLKYPLEYLVSRNGENLSGGEIAKICIIRELYKEKKVLFIDEPFNDIDSNSSKDILKLLFSLDITIVIVAHGLKRINEFDSVLKMQDGKIL